ncbi:MAG: prepilin peptidase [Candidatus Velthaea sp.]
MTAASSPIAVHVRLIVAFLLVGSALAAVSDIRSGRIPNGLTYGLAIVALSVHTLAGPIDAAVALLCMAGVLAASLPIFAFDWLKGGDVKMIVACAGLVSVHYLLPFLLYTMLCGGAVSIVVAWRHGTLRRSLHAVGSVAHPLLAGVSPSTLPFTARKVPYGVAIFCGSLLTAIAMTAIPALRLM